MRWYIIILIAMVTLSCGSHKKTTTIKTTTARDSIVYKEKIIVKQGATLTTVIKEPCDSLGRIKPFKQTLSESGTNVSIETKDGSFAVTVTSDEQISTEKEVVKVSEKVLTSDVLKEKIKFRIPKFVWYYLIVTGLYISYRVARIFYPVLRTLPY